MTKTTMLLKYFRNRSICINQRNPHYILLTMKGPWENGPQSFPTDLQTLLGGWSRCPALTAAGETQVSNCSTVVQECMARQPLLANKWTLSHSYCFSSELKQDLGRKSRIVSWPEIKKGLLNKILLNHYKFLLVDLFPLSLRSWSTGFLFSQ